MYDIQIWADNTENLIHIELPSYNITVEGDYFDDFYSPPSAGKATIIMVDTGLGFDLKFVDSKDWESHEYMM